MGGFVIVIGCHQESAPEWVAHRQSRHGCLFAGVRRDTCAHAARSCWLAFTDVRALTRLWVSQYPLLHCRQAA